jgi:hypothetical protein
MLHSQRMSRRAIRIAVLAMGALSAGSTLSEANSTKASVLNTANYDTAWTFLYSGGRSTSGAVIDDYFHDVKVLPNGEAICVGTTRDSALIGSILLMKVSASGKMASKSILKKGGAASLLIASNGDYLVGGSKVSDPYLLLLDPQFNIKWSSWYYDSTRQSRILSKGAAINALMETENGGIIAAAGDVFPDQTLNYAAYLAFDSLGIVKGAHEWLNTTGYDVAGWSIAATEGGGYLMGGKQALFYLDTLGLKKFEIDYTFNLAGVGTETSKISRIHRLRDGTVMVAGQTYEDDCWTRYQSFHYDAWWTPLSAGGDDLRRYMTGASGEFEIINDFTQLLNGNIAFVGRGVGGLWSFVTDSTGQNILWSKSVRIPFKTDNGSALAPYSVTATPDSGFTVVGRLLLTDSLGGQDAFAAHFVPIPVTATKRPRSAPNLRNTKMSQNWVFTFDARQASDAELRLFTLQGQLAGRFSQHMAQAGRGEIKADASQLKAGMYLWQLRVGPETTKGLVTLSH